MGSICTRQGGEWWRLDLSRPARRGDHAADRARGAGDRSGTYVLVAAFQDAGVFAFTGSATPEPGP